jgi:hypothetical protein
MNYGQILENAQNFIDDARGRRFDKPVLRRYMNNAVNELQRVMRQSDPSFFADQVCYSVVAADDAIEFDLPADFIQAIAVERLTDSYPVPATLINFAERHPAFDNRFLPDGLTTPPTYYLRGSKIGIVKPTESYTLRLVYSKAITASTNDSAIPDIPVEYHELIALSAAKRAMASEGMKFPGDLEQLRQEGLRELREAMDDRVNTGPTYVNVQY